MNNKPSDQSTYRDAGFNRFFRRSIGSNPRSINLSTSSSGSQQQINFDDVQVSGPLGDMLRVGRMTLDGKNGRMSAADERSNEVARFGDLGNG